MRKLFILPILISGFHLFGQDNPISYGISNRTLIGNNENMNTPFFSVDKFGWFGVISSEIHPEYYYPNFNDFNPSGYVWVDPQNSVIEDFNNDGKEDILIVWYVGPHTIDKESKLTYSLHLNNGKGEFELGNHIFETGESPERFFAYRSGSADFNNDGLPDIVSSSMGKIERNPNGTYINKFEPIPLLLSTPNGKLKDATSQIEGQESGGLPLGFSFGHDLSIGDINGDGFDDFFTGKCLFINDGKGFFVNYHNKLPIEFRSDEMYIMSSVIGDLNNDGIGDLIVTYSEDTNLGSGNIWMSKNGDSTFTNREIIRLPVGRYGSGTKFNHGVCIDLNNDGLNDLVFSVTRANPYYVGRTLQIFINKGNNIFEDLTDDFIEFPEFLETSHGEGQLFAKDINNDGLLDLIHSGAGSDQNKFYHGVIVYLNSGEKLKIVNPDKFAWVQPWQINGYEGFKPFWNNNSLRKAIPIDIDGKEGLDFISYVNVPLSGLPQNEPNEIIFYSIISNNTLVEDSIPPVLKIKNITLELNEEGTTSFSFNDIDEGTTDNHKLDSIIISKSTFTCSEIGKNIIEVKARDISGNETNSSVEINVLDKIIPHLKVKKSFVTELNDDGKATIKWEDLDEGSFDNCGILLRTLSKFEFTKNDVGVNEIIYSLEDSSGNKSSANIEVFVNISNNRDYFLEDQFSFMIFPNPSNGIINIRFKNNFEINLFKVEIFDIDGKLYLVNFIKNNDSINLKSSGLKNGIYFLKITNEKSSITKRFILCD